MIKALLVLSALTAVTSFNITQYQTEVEEWLEELDPILKKFQSLLATFTWNSSTDPLKYSDFSKAKSVALLKNHWRNLICQSNLDLNLLKPNTSRKLYLLCRGIKLTDQTLLSYYEKINSLSNAYNEKVCIEDEYNRNFPLGKCFYGEPDLEKLMRDINRSPDEQKFIWKLWHDSKQWKIKQLFYQSVLAQNQAARANGYHDVGEVWREELEIPKLETYVQQIYREIKPLYVLLHAFIRHVLRKQYGNLVSKTGPIPIHLLGNLWGQDWSSLIEIMDLPLKNIDLTRRLKEGNYTVRKMVAESEDFYTSLGLPRMTEVFWEKSIFESNNKNLTCHGTAANLFKRNDYRMLMCGEVSSNDFYVVHHEMGHIHYYMAYENQSFYFQEGANSAVHETVGDSIMHGVLTPQHLHRLGLINDREVYDPNVEMLLLLKQALEKIPELPFALLLDKYRWKIFRGDIPFNKLNREYWRMTLELRGILAPDKRNESFFDAAGKFHIADNTPYIRYFLAGILQMDVFKSFCQMNIFGKPENKDKIKLPLHRCDIYGCKKCGKKLREATEKGSSIRWSQVLKILTGHETLTTKPFLEYYEPLFRWLLVYLKENQIPIGW